MSFVGCLSVNVGGLVVLVGFALTIGFVMYFDFHLIIVSLGFIGCLFGFGCVDCALVCFALWFVCLCCCFLVSVAV